MRYFPPSLQYDKSTLEPYMSADTLTYHHDKHHTAYINKLNTLGIFATQNAENPLAHGKIALLRCDAWEHSYYLDFQNRRAKYLQIFLKNLLNWDFVNSQFC